LTDEPAEPVSQPAAGPSGPEAADRLNDEAVSLLEAADGGADGLRPAGGAAALPLLEAALAANPHHAYATFNRLLLEWRSGATTDDAVVGELHALLRRHPHTAEVKALIGWAEAERGNGAWARAAFTAAAADGAPVLAAAARGAGAGAGAAPAGAQAARPRESLHLALPFDRSHRAALITRDGRVHARPHRHRDRAWDPASGGICAWEIAGGAEIRRALLYRSAKPKDVPIAVASIAMSRTGDLIVAGGPGPLLCWWRARETAPDESAAGRAAALVDMGEIAITGEPASVAAAPDGSWFAAGTHTGHILACRRDGRHAFTVDLGASVTALAISPDGRHLAAACEDGAASLWFAGGEPAGDRLVHGTAISAAVFAAAGRLFVTASAKDGALRVWDVATSACARTLPAGQRIEALGTVDGDDRLVAAVQTGPRPCVRLWDVVAGRAVRTFEAGKTRYLAHTVDASGVTVVAREPDPAEHGPSGPRLGVHAPHLPAGCGGERRADGGVAGGGGAGHASAPSGPPAEEDLRARYQRVPPPAQAARATPVRARPLLTERVLEGHGLGTADALAFDPTGRTLLARNAGDGRLLLWDTATGRLLRELRPSGGGAWLPPADARWGAELDRQRGRLRVVEVATGETVVETEVGAGGAAAPALAGVKLSRDGTLLVLCGDHPEIRRLATGGAGARASSLRLRPDRLAHATPTLSDDGRLLATASSDARHLTIWRTEVATIVRDVNLGGPLSGLAVGSGAAVASVARDRLLVIPLPAGPPHQLRGAGRHVARALSVTADGRRALTGGLDGDLCLWDVSRGSLLGHTDLHGRLDGHAAAVASLALSPEGTLAASGSKDRTVRLWRLIANTT
jgi:WD40 repeat protein